MKAIKIDVTNRTVTEVELTKGDTLKGLQGAVGGLITAAVEFENRDTLYVNDEGLFMFQEFFYLEGCPQPYAGNGIIAGCDDEGDTVAAQTRLDEIRSKVRFLDRRQVQKLAQEMGC